MIIIYNGWQVAIDLRFDDGENRNIVNSPLFNNEESANEWAEKIDMNFTEWEGICDGVDFVMCHWVNGSVAESYII